MGETRTKKPSKRSLRPQNIGRNGKGPSSIDASQLHVNTSEVSRKTSQSSLPPSEAIPTLEDPFGIRPLFEAREVEGHGIGLYTLKTIPRGTLVLAEIPSIRVTAKEEADEVNAEEVIQAKFNASARFHRKQFMRLHDSQKTTFSQVRSIYHTNCYNLAAPRSEHGGSCLGLQASRINHSCVPNVQFSFLETTPAQLLPQLARHQGLDASEEVEKKGVMLFYAIKKIQRGHEILSNYESAYVTSQQRQRVMQFHYGFRCDCKACVPDDNPFWVKSDARRRELMACKVELGKLEKLWKTKPGTSRRPTTELTQGVANINLEQSDDETIRQAISTLQRMIELLELEGLTGIDLVNIYHKLVKWSCRDDEKDLMAIERLKRLEEQAIITAFGPYSPRLDNRIA